MTDIDDILTHWGEGRVMSLFAQSLTSDVQQRFYATFERASASPRMARALVQSLESMDVRPLLGALTCPTLVLHRTGDRVLPVWTGQMMAELIPGARFVELEGVDHAFWF